MNRTYNMKEAIKYEIKFNSYDQGYHESVKINMYNTKKYDIILDMLWLGIHNSEIDWNTKEVKMKRCLLICRQKCKNINKEKKEKKPKEKKKEIAKVRKIE